MSNSMSTEPTPRITLSDPRGESGGEVDDGERLTGIFPNARTLPNLPEGFEWATEKKAFCPRNLLKERASAATLTRKRRVKVWGESNSARKIGAIETKQSMLRRCRDNKGSVFCHRGLYEHASGKFENTRGALTNGTNEGFRLHELDAFVPTRLDQAFVAHDVAAGRVSTKEGRWEDYSFHEILRTLLISHNVKDCFIEEPGKPGFASSYKSAQDRVLGVLETFWGDLLGKTGRTVQIDLREEDLAKAIPHYAFHISKDPASSPTARARMR
ncbi:hypothetical protein CPLU01_09350 [Colletotrichum plurivorum]|uniref:Uncharacterized protein n=1 Tax=Colletotrichum plurivorum TaxID=2175906 RepID=A0A8H6KA77_9PEZI|nr:hypothetical protein CPLU01_09350 [Colletotrichum plurivorum]